MRTKVLCAAALAAGALTSMAQVYSANVVGYVNLTVKGGGAFNLIANPLDATMGGTVANGNNISNLFGTLPGDSDTIFRWNVGNFSFDNVTPGYSAFTHAWNTTFDLKPGEAVFYNNNNDDFTVTFVGQVNQGAWNYAGGLNGTPNVVTGNGAFNALGAPVPLGGSFTNAIGGITAGDSDTIFTWDVANFQFSGITPGYSSFTHAWTHTEVEIAPGVGFFYNNNNDDQPWNVNFTVQ